MSDATDVRAALTVTNVGAADAAAESGAYGAVAVQAVVGPLTSAPAAAATPQAVLNAAVINWFDSTANWLSSLPANPIGTWLGGALLLTRRALFNQTPTAAPVQVSVSELTGQIVGTLGVIDAEGDPVLYSLTQVPQFGTVQIAPDGTYTYTPTVDGLSDTFTVAVTDEGFNILDPFGSRSTIVAVPVQAGTRGFDVINMTGQSVKLIEIDEEKDGWIQAAPALGTVLAPGQSFHTEIYAPTFTTYDTRFLFARCTDASSACEHTEPDRPNAEGAWTVVFTVGSGNGDTEAWCEGSTCSFDRTSWGTYSISRSAFLVEQPGTTVDVYPDTPYGAATLAGMFDWYNKQSASAVVTASYDNAVFTNQTPAPTEFKQVLNLDNYSDSKSSGGSRTITSSYSATQSKTQQCSVPGCTYDLSQLSNPGNYITVIMGLISGQIAKNYSVTESETQTKTFATTLSLTSPPWSVNRILAASPELNTNGDVTVTYETFVDPRSRHADVSGALQKFVFHNLDFVYPDPSKSTTEPVYYVRSEPFQPKDAYGKPVANVGFTVVDKKSPYLNPEISVGQRDQLTVTAFNGYGGDNADYTRRATYTSSDPTVATVDSSGLLVGIQPGTATIAARYDWTIPTGNGVVTDYVIATMGVTVSAAGEVVADPV